jgi:hypothetical protein
MIEEPIGGDYDYPLDAPLHGWKAYEKLRAKQMDQPLPGKRQHRLLALLAAVILAGLSARFLFYGF